MDGLLQVFLVIILALELESRRVNLLFIASAKNRLRKWENLFPKFFAIQDKGRKLLDEPVDTQRFLAE